MVGRIVGDRHLSRANSFGLGLEGNLNCAPLPYCKTLPAVVLLEEISAYCDAGNLELGIPDVRQRDLFGRAGLTHRFGAEI